MPHDIAIEPLEEEPSAIMRERARLEQEGTALAPEQQRKEKRLSKKRLFSVMQPGGGEAEGEEES